MESTENGSIDDTLDTRNLEDPAEHLEDIVVASYEECKSEVPSSQAEENQSVGQVMGNLELQTPSGETHTIYINPQDLNKDGQHFVLAEDDEVELPFLPDGQLPLEPLSNESSLHPGGGGFEDGPSQSIEFIKAGEVGQGESHSHVYKENSGAILNIKNDSQCSVGNTRNTESPLWSVSGNGNLNCDGPSNLRLVPNSAMLIAPDEMKYRKLMQLACLAHEASFASVDQNNNSAAVGVGNSSSVRNTESPLSE